MKAALVEWRDRLAAGAYACGWVAALALMLANPPLHAAEDASKMRWQLLQQEHFGKAPVVTDARVRVIAPATAEDALNVPVAVRVEGLAGVEEVRVLVDYNPIVKAIEFFPLRAQPALTFRLKLQQSSPIRALARTTDGVWHMGMTVVEAAGGGCTAPSLGSAAPDWKSALGQVSSRRYASSTPTGGTRLRLQVQHPMDTGLAPGIPAFYLERLAVVDSAGTERMRIHAFEPISENPVFSIDLLPGDSGDGLSLRGVDNQGNRVAARLAP